MAKPIVVVASKTGTTAMALQSFSPIKMKDYTLGAFILAFPSYGSPRTGGYVPKNVQNFLDFNSHNLVGVVGVGNRTFGSDFCRGAYEVAEHYDVPIITNIDVVPTKDDVDCITEFLKEYE